MNRNKKDINYIERSFVRIKEGQIHLRIYENNSNKTKPLYIVHPSPGSAKSIEKLILLFGQTRKVIAPDTLGNGDSAPPLEEKPTIKYFADSIIRVLDKLNIEQADFYGIHTGGRIGCELAVKYSDRFKKVVIDGIADYSPRLKKQILKYYAPQIKPDDFGNHLLWALNFIRDQSLFFPYFSRECRNIIKREPYTAGELHSRTLEVLKSLTTYHKAYEAAFRYPAKKRVPKIKSKTLMIIGHNDPVHLRNSTKFLSKLSTQVELKTVKSELSEKVSAANLFFKK